jgi:putative transposase
MSHTCGNIVLHLIFSTRERRPLIKPEFRSELFSYLGGIVREMHGSALIINGAADHVHMLVRTRPAQAPAEVARVVKTNSSRWVREKWSRNFGWQTGYGVFSVSESNVAAVTKYIASQEEHHKKHSFQDELCIPQEEWDGRGREIYLGLVSFAPPGLDVRLCTLPTACAVGCILSPLRGSPVSRQFGGAKRATFCRATNSHSHGAFGSPLVKRKNASFGMAIPKSDVVHSSRRQASSLYLAHFPAR